MIVPPLCFATCAIRVASSVRTLAKSAAVYGFASGKVATWTSSESLVAVVIAARGLDRPANRRLEAESGGFDVLVGRLRCARPPTACEDEGWNEQHRG